MKKTLFMLVAVLMMVCSMVLVASAVNEYPPIEIRFDGDEDALAITTSYASSLAGEVKDGRLSFTATTGDSKNVSLVIPESVNFTMYD